MVAAGEFYSPAATGSMLERPWSARQATVQRWLIKTVLPLAWRGPVYQQKIHPHCLRGGCPVVAMEIGLFLCHLFFLFALAFYTKFWASIASLYIDIEGNDVREIIC